MNTSSNMPTYTFDAFISYSHKDKRWVRNILLPFLEKNNAKVIIDFRDFEPGAPLIVEMERAVKESRKTIIVLTNNYLKSAWGEFESIIAATLDPAGRNRKLLPILREKVQLPTRISYLTYIDFTDDMSESLSWEKLIQFVKGDKKIAEPYIPIWTEEVVVKHITPGISNTTQKKLRSVLIECEELTSNSRLRALFRVQELSSFRTAVPEANNISERVDLLIDLLVRKKFDTGQSLLIVFLNVLLSRIPENDELYNQLSDVIVMIRDELNVHNSHENLTTQNKFHRSDQYPNYIEDIFVRLDSLENILSHKLDTLKQGQIFLYKKIQQDDVELIKKILDGLHQGEITQKEVKRGIDEIQQALKYVLDKGVEINDPNVTDMLIEIYQSVNSGLTFAQQFELTLPIIPFLLEYKINMVGEIDLQAVWDEFRALIKKKN